MRVYIYVILFTLQVLTEEFKGQAPLFEKFIQSGHAILDLCEADSKDASHISEKMDVISKDWSRLESRLQERGRALKSVEGLSLEFNDIMKTVQDWMEEFSDRVGNITPGTLSPEENESYLQELEVLWHGLPNNIFCKNIYSFIFKVQKLLNIYDFPIIILPICLFKIE